VALTIILILIFGVVAWAFFMTHTNAGARRAEKFQKPNYLGTVRRYAKLGRPVVQSDEQRSEVMRMNRGLDDPSLDRLDPRHEKYRGDDGRGDSPDGAR
jgi:hypothetical protein